MPSLSMKTIFEASAAGRTTEALRQSSALLREHPDCPHLLVFHSMLIRVEDPVESDCTLEDAEAALLKAHEIDKCYLPALEELAHFYDAINPDPAKAFAFAKAYLERSRKTLKEMQAIVDEYETGSDDETLEE